MPVFREANDADIAAICALGNEVNAVHHRAHPEIFAAAGEELQDAGHWLGGVAKPDATTFVAEDGGRLVGFASVRIVDEAHTLLQPLRYGTVGSVGVTQERRGTGIGRELLQRVHDWVTARGGVEVRLNVWAFNADAIRLYRELGYETQSLLLAKQLSVQSDNSSRPARLRGTA